MTVRGASGAVRGAAVVVLTLLVNSVAVAQGRSQIVNGAVTTKSATASVAQELALAAAQQRSTWVGYRVTTIAMRQDWCSSGGRTTRVMLEPSRAMTLLARLEAGALTQLRGVSDGCEIDAGGLPVLWLDNVSVDASQSWLASLLQTEAVTRDQRKMREQALSVLAWHDGAAAANTLIAVARNDRQADTRSRALFWISQRAGQAATAVISGAIDRDPDAAVRKKAVFALSQLPGDQSVPLLIQVARTHESGEVRRQAMFWLGQSRDPRALAFFEEVLRR